MSGLSHSNLAYFPVSLLAIFLVIISQCGITGNIQYPQGYYPFEESPARIPPIVRKPPYLQTQVKCPGLDELGSGQEQTLDNLCGDLNKGYLPVNPIGQNVLGVSYPFELIKNKTLDFFSKTLPILKADDTLPKVAKYQDSHIMYNPTIFNSQPNTRIKFYENERKKRDIEEGDDVINNDDAEDEMSEKIERKKREAEAEKDVESEQISSLAHMQIPQTARESRSWCEDSFGVFCMLFNAMKGDKNEAEATDRLGQGDADIPGDVANGLNGLDQPMTPCPSAVEYVTPVFAKNYQGVWRYVVQIPYEGYFTQTVEVVKCLSTKCQFLQGSCLASPRWVSLLVAEIYYPDTFFPTAEQPISGRDPIKASPPTDYNQYLLKRSGQGQGSEVNCDGHDELGCYTVRLYYDWFLIPGSCKCWKNDFFSQYISKK